jgi:hypothetical protein
MVNEIAPGPEDIPQPVLHRHRVTIESEDEEELTDNNNGLPNEDEDSDEEEDTATAEEDLYHYYAPFDAMQEEFEQEMAEIGA